MSYESEPAKRDRLLAEKSRRIRELEAELEESRQRARDGARGAIDVADDNLCDTDSSGPHGRFWEPPTAIVDKDVQRWARR